ncbi:MAG: hypothetical protein GY839_03385 [candidate division Zixibacteria bacterium]|nr:hypothetical protein [candidate division Zixibacteria bacterium]
MKRMMVISMAMTVLVLLISGCETEKTVYIDEYPPAPTGLTSISGDESITLLWYPVEVDDIDSYEIWWAPGNVDPDDTDEYDLLDIISYSYSSLIDNDVENGVTYYYRLIAVDESGNHSYMSDYVMDTPRAEGHNVVIYDPLINFGLSGYDLYFQDRLTWNDTNCDIWLDYNSQYDEFFINVRHDDYYIQDFGYAEDFDDVGYAPSDGWSAFDEVEAIEGHMYILKLNHFDEWHYARIWVTDLNYQDVSMRFSWAYQIDQGNRELAIGPQSVKPITEVIPVN